MKKEELKQLIKEVISETKPVINEARKVKFILYTNPNNTTNNAYIAIGPEVKEVLSDARRYPGSYDILYQSSGTNDDLQKAKKMFSDYKFNDSIRITEMSKPVKHIKDYTDVRVGDMAYGSPDAGGDWDYRLGKIIWKGTYPMLMKSKFSKLFDAENWAVEEDENINKIMAEYDLVIVDMNTGAYDDSPTLFNYNNDPSGCVVYKN